MIKNNKKFQIFLSYTRLDKTRVSQLYKKLNNAGYKPWMDIEDIFPGEKWDYAIKNAIRNSNFIIICLSQNSVNKRGYFQKEIRKALDISQEMLDSDIYLIPVRIEECELPDSLSSYQTVDLFKTNGWNKLIKAIDEGINRRANS